MDHRSLSPWRAKRRGQGKAGEEVERRERRSGALRGGRGVVAWRGGRGGARAVLRCLVPAQHGRIVGGELAAVAGSPARPRVTQLVAMTRRGVAEGLPAGGARIAGVGRVHGPLVRLQADAVLEGPWTLRARELGRAVLALVPEDRALGRELRPAACKKRAFSEADSLREMRVH